MSEQRKKSDKVLGFIKQAVAIIQSVGVPTEEKTERGLEKMAMVLLAVAGVTRSFDQAKGLKERRFLKTRDIIAFINEHFEENISSGSYDDIRRKDLKLLLLADLVLKSAANPNAATNDPTRSYTLAPDFAELVRTFGSEQWPERLTLFLQDKIPLKQILTRERAYQKVSVQFPDGKLIEFSPGEHNDLQKAIIEEFLPRFGPRCRVLYVGDTANKFAHIERQELERLNFFELAHAELPDIIAHDPQKNWLYLIEAVHSSGSISEVRMLELKRLTRGCKAEIIYVTAFLTKKEFKKWAVEIAWETEVWIAEKPDHMIHFNGDKFLGPYKPEEDKGANTDSKFKPRPSFTQNTTMNTFLEELRWRGLIHDSTPGVEEHLQSGPVRGYIGFDPTAPSLGIGNYVQIMLLTFLQRAGHQPVVLMGGATGRIGDPSGKDAERDLKNYEELDRNTAHQAEQVKTLLDFNPASPNHALLVNNLDFYKDMNVLDFLRDVGKYLTVNYMLSKESVKRRIESESGISFTEFSYQLLQGYDFVLLNRQHGITLQMGGSDQFGNITAGVELARKIDGAKVFAITTPLLTKADGAKFGKSESGNIFLDPNLTSPYRFYQFWLNADDRDLPKFLRYFSLKTKEEIEALEANETTQNAKRIFSEEITVRIHGQKEFKNVLAVSQLLFDPKADAHTLRSLDARTLAQVAEEIPAPQLPLSALQNGLNILDFLSENTGILPSRSEAKKAIQNNAISVNKQKISDPNASISAADLLHGKFVMVENGKKNKYLVQVG